MKNFIFLFTFLCTTTLHSQVAVNEIKTELFGNPFNQQNQAHINNLKAIDLNAEKNLNNLLEDWSSASVEDYDGNVYAVDSMNFNIDNNVFLFMKDGEFLMLKGEKVKSVDLQYRRFDRFRSLGFCEVLSDGDIPLIKHYSMQEEKSYTNPMGMPGTEKFELVVHEDVYYFENDRKLYHKVPRKKSELLKLFKSKKNKVVEYAKENKLSNKREVDLIKIFAYYNSLFSQS